MFRQTATHAFNFYHQSPFVFKHIFPKAPFWVLSCEKDKLKHEASLDPIPEPVWIDPPTPNLKGNSGIFKPRPYFWHEIRSSTHREQFGESRRPSEDI